MDLVKNAEFVPGGCGPDVVVIELKGGELIVVGPEGINVFPHTLEYVEGAEPSQAFVFATGNVIPS